LSIKPAGAAGAAAGAAAARATGEMLNFSIMEKHDKTGKYCCGCGTRNFETKLNTPQNRNIPKWKIPVFFSHSLIRL